MTSIVFAQVIGPCALVASEHTWSSKEQGEGDVGTDTTLGGKCSMLSMCPGFILGSELSLRADCSVLSAVSWLSYYEIILLGL